MVTLRRGRKRQRESEEEDLRRTSGVEGFEMERVGRSYLCANARFEGHVPNLVLKSKLWISDMSPAQKLMGS